jgi:hypothetical protein
MGVWSAYTVRVTTVVDVAAARVGLVDLADLVLRGGGVAIGAGAAAVNPAAVSALFASSQVLPFSSIAPRLMLATVGDALGVFEGGGEDGADEVVSAGAASGSRTGRRACRRGRAAGAR